MTRPLALIVFIVALAASVSRAQAPDPRATMAAQAAARIRALQVEADRLAGESRTLLGDLRRLELERQISRETLSAADADLERVNAALEATRARVAALEMERVHAAPALAAELVEIYKRGRQRQAQVLLASAADSRALGRLVRGVVVLANAQRLQIERHRQALRAENEATAELERQMLAAEASRERQMAAEATLERTVAERNRLVDAIDRERDVAAQYAGELQAAQIALERTVASLGAGPSAGSPAPVPPLPIAPFKGDLDWPVRGVLRSRFAPFAPGSPGRSPSAIVRNGIEVTATEGSPVSAVHGGRVSYAAPFVGLGTLVVVDHGQGVQTLYGHLANVAVAVGNAVERGTQVGQVGLGLSRVQALAPAGSAVLYFELRVDGRPVDPLQWLRSSP
jgi:septal ring factor EnvC (AmiA/AmiB activator)